MSANNWFAPERSVPGMTDLTGTLNAIWAGILLTEVVTSIAIGRQVYNLRQCINNLSSWLLTTLYISLVKALLVLPYAWLHNKCTLVQITPDNSRWVHLAAFVYSDAIFYCGHRLAHECNLMWSAHVVHHSSPDYNYSTGFRASFLEHTLPFMFYWPLALVCPPEVYFFHKFLNQILQLWVHTELITKLPWPIEFILVTPSHHRVHHARNYGRKNFSGLFIIWDRMFGTFQEERTDRKPVYGLNSQPVVQGTYNPLWHQVHHLVATFRLAASGKVSLFTAFYTRTTGPGMINPTTTEKVDEKSKALGKEKAGSAVSISARAAVRHDTPFDPSYPWERRPLGALDLYAAFQFFVLLLPAFVAFIAAIPDLPTVQVLSGAFFTAWTITSTAWLCGAEPRAVRLELARLAVQAGAALFLVQQGTNLPYWGTMMAKGAIGHSCAAATVLLVASRPAQHGPAVSKPVAKIQ